MPTRIREGDVVIELDDAMERLARDAAERVAPGLLKRLEGRFGQILGWARREWPVRTGLSKGGLDTRVTFGNEEVTVELVNTVDYAIYVRPSKWYGATTAWQRLVRGPVQRLVREEVDRIVGDEVRRALSNG